MSQFRTKPQFVIKHDMVQNYIETDLFLHRGKGVVGGWLIGPGPNCTHLH